MSTYADKTLQCRDCGENFVFTAGEQEFYVARGFSEPTRCQGCRAARKASREGGSGSGYSSGGGGYSSGGSGYGSSGGGGYSGGGSYSAGGRSSYGGGRSGGGGSRQMYKVTCAECGQETEVPFEPRNGRPVYCRDCFERRSGQR